MPRRGSSARARATRIAAWLVALLATRALAAPDAPREERILLAPGQAVLQAPGRDGRIETRIVDRFAPLRLIVRLDAPPALAAHADASERERATRRVEASAERLAADLATLAAPMRAANGGRARAEVTRTFTQAFSGAAITLEPALLARLRALPYVRGVWPDDTVRADLAQSVPLIRANPVRLQLGIDGTGVRVGIVDTGIDWTHPALGGGFGPGHRVAAGWDFVHGDADPMDDHGHGTHVAGILGGAGGSIVGVAPGVTFVAFKVLDANGYGYDSNVLAALDRVTDPDQDPGTDDGCHVINLSLGGGVGDPDDPMSRALDQLTDAGVVCCVAAGNSGPWSSTIQSPGSSRRAITVAATSKQDLVETSSSRGPVPGSFELKPDVAAPGVDIVSAARGGGTIALSGTSMATPHVAGVAALVRQYRPAWNADVVKAAIVEHAHLVPFGPFEVGAGRLDAFDAVRSGFVITPTNLAFGRVPTTTATHTRAREFTVHNLLPTQQTVTMPDSVVLAPGAKLTFSPRIGTLLAGDSVSVTVTLTVDNTFFVAPLDAPFATAGTFTVRGAADSARLTTSFHECAVLGVRSRSQLAWMGIESSSREWIGPAPYSQEAIPVRPGLYDLIARFESSHAGSDFTFGIHEGVVVRDSTMEVMEPSEATTTYTFEGVDADDQPLVNKMGQLVLRRDGAPRYMTLIGYPFGQVSVSPASSAFVLEWVLVDSDRRTYWHAVPGAQRGFGASRTFRNSASDLRRIAMQLPTVPADSALLIVKSMLPIDSVAWYMTVGTWNSGLPVLRGQPETFDYQLAPSPYPYHEQLGVGLEMYPASSDALGLASLHFLGPALRLDLGWPFALWDGPFFLPRWGVFGGSRMAFPVGLPVWRLPFASDADSIRFGLDSDGAMHAFADEVGSIRLEEDPPYTLRRNGVEIASGTVRGAGGFTYRPLPAIDVPGTGDVDFHTEHPYTRIGRSAIARVDAHLVLTSYSPNPPTLRSLQVLSNDAPSDSIDLASAANPRVRLRANDDGGNPAQVVVRVRGALETEWRSLVVVNHHDVHEAALPVSLDGPIDMEVEVRDEMGNTLRHSWSPAFFATRDPGTVPAEQRRVAMLGAWPNPACEGAVSLAFMLASNAPATIALYDVTGREVLAQGVPSPRVGPQRIALDRAASLRPGLYFAKLAQGGHESRSRIVVIR